MLTRRRPTYADVMATVAVFLVLAGGTAFAATKMLPKNSVGSGQLRKGAVTPAKLSKASKAMFAASTGTAGAIGPQGPVGPAGARGERGEKGPGGEPGHDGIEGKEGKEGERGEPGTANVIYSAWQYASLKPTPEAYDDTLTWSATISAPSLTAAAINSGSISVYTTFGDEDFPLPYTSEAGSKPSTIAYTMEPGTITIRRSTPGCAVESCLVNLSSLLQYRYVIIPGAVPGG